MSTPIAIEYSTDIKDYHAFFIFTSTIKPGFKTIVDPADETNTTYIKGRWYFEPIGYDGEIVFSNSYAEKNTALYGLVIFLRDLRTNQPLESLSP